jgi:hypothetical protein
MRKPTLGQTVTLLLGAAVAAITGENVARSESNADVAGGTSDLDAGLSSSAGDWFPELALGLAENASPPLLP